MAIATVTGSTITDLLKQDHRRMKDMFNDFEDADFDRRKEIVAQALELIQVHDQAETKLLYPNVRRHVDAPRELLLRCEEAHHVANVIISELNVLPYNERYFVKFEKLAHALREHIDEEEQELFPAIERSSLDLAELGRRMERMKGTMRFGVRAEQAIGGRIGMFAGVGAIGALAYLVYRYFSED